MSHARGPRRSSERPFVAVVAVVAVVVIAAPLGAASLGCSWILGISGDPVVVDEPASDAGDEDAVPPFATDAAKDAAGE